MVSSIHVFKIRLSAWEVDRFDPAAFAAREIRALHRTARAAMLAIRVNGRRKHRLAAVPEQIEHAPLIARVEGAIGDAHRGEIELGLALGTALAHRRAGEHAADRRNLGRFLRVDVHADELQARRRARRAEHEAHARVGPALPNVELKVCGEPVGVLLPIVRGVPAVRGAESPGHLRARAARDDGETLLAIGRRDGGKGGHGHARNLERRIGDDFGAHRVRITGEHFAQKRAPLVGG